MKHDRASAARKRLAVGRGSRREPQAALQIRLPRHVIRVGDKTFPFLRNVEKAQATARLVDYVEEAGHGPIVVTIRGRPVAFLAAVNGRDLESLSIGTDPSFTAWLARSRASHAAGRGVPLETVRLRQAQGKRG